MCVCVLVALRSDGHRAVHAPLSLAQCVCSCTCSAHIPYTTAIRTREVCGGLRCRLNQLLVKPTPTTTTSTAKQSRGDNTVVFQAHAVSSSRHRIIALCVQYICNIIILAHRARTASVACVCVCPGFLDYTGGTRVEQSTCSTHMRRVYAARFHPNIRAWRVSVWSKCGFLCASTAYHTLS